MNDPDGHMTLQPRGSKRASKHVSSTHFVQWLVVAEHEIDGDAVGRSILVENRLVRPQPRGFCVEDDRGSVGPFSQRETKVASAVCDSRRDGLPVANGGQWGGDHLRNGSGYRTLFCV